MTNNTTALTDEQIIEIAARLGSQSLNVTRVHEIGGPTRTIFDEAGLLELATEIRALLTSPRAAVPAPDGWKLVPIERSYDMRVKALLAFNTTEKETNDRDDALD
ncbi:hypothetical protein, partial [Burkholderia gladioli]|uniref:hypothetical protein n=1 Tax=Burkholderia gladioli TaxID=28095 RepID=UPI00163F2F44